MIEHILERPARIHIRDLLVGVFYQAIVAAVPVKNRTNKNLWSSSPFRPQFFSETNKMGMTRRLGEAQQKKESSFHCLPLQFVIIWIQTTRTDPLIVPPNGPAVLQSAPPAET